MHVKMLPKIHFYFAFLIYTLIRRISVHLFISVNIIMVSPATLRSIFLFLSNMSLFVIKHILMILKVSEGRI